MTILLDEDLEDGTWRWEPDFKNKDRKILLVAVDIFQKLRTGLIPDELKDEIVRNANGGSPL
jgi:hypothetical protein